MIILNMVFKKLYIQLSFWYIYRIYILFQLLKMGEVKIELFYLVGPMETGVEQCYIVLL